MQETDLQYPPETCPFCTIAAAHPCPGTGHETGASVPTATTAPPSLWRSASEQQRQALRACVPSDEESDPEKTSPSSFVVLRSSDVVAFLDILPMTWGESSRFSFCWFCVWVGGICRGVVGLDVDEEEQE